MQGFQAEALRRTQGGIFPLGPGGGEWKDMPEFATEDWPRPPILTATQSWVCPCLILTLRKLRSAALGYAPARHAEGTHARPRPNSEDNRCSGRAEAPYKSSSEVRPNGTARRNGFDCGTPEPSRLPQGVQTWRSGKLATQGWSSRAHRRITHCSRRTH